ncbi:MAG: hypothetical protein Q9166_000445 [cf. Caloplaca sp. 2 TL-2023]
MINDSAPAPAIPPRTSIRTPKKWRRRRSLPNTSSASTAKRSPNNVTVKPASPEVISSLISSLSAISSLTESHFGNYSHLDYSHSMPASPNHYHTDFLSPSLAPTKALRHHPASPSKIAFGMEHDSPGHLYLAPGAVAPVHASLRSNHSYQDLRPRSQLRYLEDKDEIRSIGQVSVEPAPWQSSASLVSTGSGHPKIKVGLGIKRPRSPTKKCAKSERHHDEHIDRVHDMIPRSAHASSVHSTTIAGRYSNDLPGSPVVGNGHIVPSRESSLRHSLGGSSSHHQRRSRRSNDSSAATKFPLTDEHNLPSVFDPRKETSIDLADDEVTRRIKELKDQKRLRDISLTVTTPDLMPPGPQLSRSTSPLRLHHSAKDPISPLPAKHNPLDKVTSDTKDERPEEKSAPSPAVVPRVDRKAKRNSIGGKPSAIHPFSSVRPSEPSRTQSTPIQRSNSKLLRRLSRPISPTTVDRHRRTLSGPMAEPHSPIERPESADPIDAAVHNYLSAPRLSQKTAHPETGRIISFSEVGDPGGSVVFCCVGMGLTRHITAFYDDLAKSLKLRLITPDRPGVGGSEIQVDGLDIPLGWPDDVLAICQKLKITKFSLLAHSAGAIYALATALRMPQYIRGRIHLLAPWIPPSQMSRIGTQEESLPANALPLSQRLLQSLPTTFLKAANSNYFRTTSASITTSLPKSPRRSKQRSTAGETPTPSVSVKAPTDSGPLKNPKTRGTAVRQDLLPRVAAPSVDSEPSPSSIRPIDLLQKERRSTYDSRLTGAIWDASTTGANPAVDLLVCLERKQPIGFRYVDITRSVIIHHGSKDTRVPIENVKWLGKTMRRCEVRVLEGEGHGLMASAIVMGNVLMEIAKEWEDWIRVVQGKGGSTRRHFSP